MTMKMQVLVPALLGCLIAAGAQAQSTSVPKEISGYRNMVVKLGRTAPDCNLKDTNLLQTQLSDELAAIGITQTDDFYANVELRVTAQKFGGILAHCATLVELVFLATIGKDNFVTSDKRLKESIDRLKVIPIIFYKEGRMGVQPQIEPTSGGVSTNTEKAVLAAIDGLVASLKAKRQ
jgi:hypothetical protein